MVPVPNEGDALGVVQDTATALRHKIDEYDPEKPFAAWACRLAFKETRASVRKHSNEQKLLAGDALDELQIIRE